MELCLTRSNLYYTRSGESGENVKAMNIMDKYYVAHPTAGVKTMVSVLRNSGITANHKRVRRLMRVMNIVAVYPKKCLSKGVNPKHIYPYMLRGMSITRRNQVWSTDISYIPMENGFMYLYAIIDVYSRYVVGWRLSNSLSASNCYELAEECILRHGAPEYINSDQGSQYTTDRWITLWESYGVKVSMDGKGRCKDNTWIERFWRTVKQEYVYLNPTDNAIELRDGLGEYIEFYNTERPHQSLADSVQPAKAYAA